MNKPLHCIFAGIVALWVFTSSCKKQANTDNNGGNNSALVAEGFVIVPRHFENQMKVTANLLPYESVEIRTPVAGTVLAIHFKEGQRIKEGQSLVQIDDRVWKAQIKGLEARLVAASEDLRRKESLLAAEGASREEVETTQSLVQQLEAQIEELEVYVDLAKVPAPFSGQVGMRDFSVGAYLSQGQVVTQIAQSDQLKIDFNISGRYVGQFPTGKEVTVVANGDSLTASVYAINPVVDANARAVRARALLKNKNNWLPGDFAEVLLVLDQQDSALVVPTQYIVPELGAETVFLYKNGKAVKQTVSTGPRNNTVALVTSGLQAGDTLLATGLMQARDGMVVRISKTVSPTEL